MMNRRTFLLMAGSSLFAQSTPRPLVLVLLGKPGGGKGTQAEKITAEFGIPAVSTGDLLRAEAKSGTPLGREVQAVMQKGELVSDDIVNRLVSDRLERADAARGVILDGYPRNVAQAAFLDRLLEQRKFPPPLVIDLEVPDEEILQRLAARGRKDDNPQTVRERLHVYAAETRPVLDYYSSRNLRRVDGLGTPEEVYARVRASILQAH